MVPSRQGTATTAQYYASLAVQCGVVLQVAAMRQGVLKLTSRPHKPGRGGSPDLCLIVSYTCGVIAVPSRGPLIFPLNPRASPCDTDEWAAIATCVRGSGFAPFGPWIAL
jgi:hypothetical protein